MLYSAEKHYVCLLLVIQKNSSIAVVVLVFVAVFSGPANSGFQVNHLDTLPRHAAILVGISNGFETLGAMVCLFVTGQLAKGRFFKSIIKYKWYLVFLTASIIHFLGIIFYAIFAFRGCSTLDKRTQGLFSLIHFTPRKVCDFVVSLLLFNFLS